MIKRSLRTENHKIFYDLVIPQNLTKIPYDYHIYLSTYHMIVNLCIKFMIRDRLNREHEI